MPEAQQPEPAVSPHVQPHDASPSAAIDREALVDDIVREIRKDSVKEEALAKLKKADAQGGFSKFFQHPATLLIIGFALTGVFGLLLTNKVQKQEWERQQQRLVKIRNADLKYAIMDELIKAVGARNATATAVVEPLLGPMREEQLRILKIEPAERFKGWQKATYDWRYNSQVLRLKLKAYIKDSKAQQNFEEITERGQTINVNIIRLQIHLEANNWALDEKSGELLDNIKTAKDETEKYLTDLTNSIVAEVEADIRRENP